jgi:hypothetical protein
MLMRAKSILLGLFLSAVVSVLVLGQPLRSTVAGTPARSGVVLLASITTACPGPARPGAMCSQPYAGEFVVTALNGAEVARMRTNYLGQAVVSLSPGRYLVGVRTEAIYPRAAPVTVDVVADRHTYVALRLEGGPRLQSSIR